MTGHPSADDPTRRRRRTALWVGGGFAAVLALVVAALLALAGGGAAGPVRALLQAKLGRSVTFSHLAVTRAPEGLRLVFTDLHLGQPKSFGPGELAFVPRAELTVRIAPLLAGRLEAPEVALTSPVLHLVRRGPGDSNYSFGKGGGASSLLGATRTLAITPGRVTFSDPQRHITLDGTVSHDPRATDLPLHLDGGGVIQGEPYRVQAQGGPLNGRKPHAPHPLKVALQDGALRMRMSGVTQAPFDFRGLDLDVEAQGPNAADLVYLFNLLAPNSPPFHMTGRMHREGKVFRVTGLQARMGDSDVEGSITSEHLDHRRIEGVLRSRRLTASDLRVILASPPPHAVARVAAGVAGRGGGTETKGKLFSRTPVSLRRLQGTDAILHYRAETATGFGLPASGVRAEVRVVGGRLAVTPLALATAGGEVRVDYTLDTTARTPAARLAARVRGLQLARAARGKGFSGRLDAEVDVRAAGASAAEQAASASGRASVRVVAGALPKKAASALSGDLFGLVGAFLSPGGQAPLRCARADFDIASGVARATRLSVSTDKGTATGGGRIDLGAETLALRLEASSRGAEPPVQLRVPIVAQGPLAHPQVKGKAPSLPSGVGDVVRSLGRLVSGAGRAAAPAAPRC